MAGTKDTSKKAVNLRIAPATLAQVDDLIMWLRAPSKNWVWEHAIERWHAAQEQARQVRLAEAAGPDDQQVIAQERAAGLVKSLIDLAWEAGMGWAGDMGAMDDLTGLLARYFVPRAAGALVDQDPDPDLAAAEDLARHEARRRHIGVEWDDPTEGDQEGAE